MNLRILVLAASAALLLSCDGEPRQPADAGPVPADASASEPRDAGLAPDAGHEHCAGGCLEGTVCCEPPAPCAGKCVPDCRLPSPCPPNLPTCDGQTGLCLPAAVVGVASELLPVRNPASGIDWWAKAFFPETASAAERYPAVVTVPGGSGAGSEAENAADPSRNPVEQAKRGFVVVVFDADGRGNTAGTEDFCGSIHQDGLAALVEAVAQLPYVDPQRVGLSTSSFGITMGSGVLARHPELPVRFLVDFEGPADRNDTGHCDASDTGHITHDCADEAWWSQREAATFVKQVQVPYLRLQGSRDHAQPDNLHCILMINNATAAAFGGLGRSPWTRVNDAQLNLANRVYSAAAPPEYLAPGTGVDLPAFWTELFGR